MNGVRIPGARACSCSRLLVLAPARGTGEGTPVRTPSLPDHWERPLASSRPPQVEQAIARAFLQEIEISRRQSRDLAVAPSVTYTTDPPRELKMLKGVTIKSKGDCAHFIGFVSLGALVREIKGD